MSRFGQIKRIELFKLSTCRPKTPSCRRRQSENTKRGLADLSSYPNIEPGVNLNFLQFEFSLEQEFAG